MPRSSRWTLRTKEQVGREPGKPRRNKSRPRGCVLVNEIKIEFQPASKTTPRRNSARRSTTRARASRPAQLRGCCAHDCHAGLAQRRRRSALPRRWKGAGSEDLIKAAREAQAGRNLAGAGDRGWFSSTQAPEQADRQGRRSHRPPRGGKKARGQILADDLAKRFTGRSGSRRRRTGPTSSRRRARCVEQYAKLTPAKDAAGRSYRRPPSPSLRHSATWTSRRSTSLRPFNTTLNPIPAALPTESPATLAFALEKPGAVHPAPIATRDGFAVMQLKEKTLAKHEDFARIGRA